MSAQHTPEIINLIAVALHAPTTGCVSIQGALFLDIISKLETAEQQRDELQNRVDFLNEQNSAQQEQNDSLKAQNAELVAATKWVVHVLSLSGNDLLSEIICGKLEPAIAKVSA